MIHLCFLPCFADRTSPPPPHANTWLFLGLVVEDGLTGRQAGIHKYIDNSIGTDGDADIYRDVDIQT